MKKPVVAVVAGPTASGKSAAAVELCRLLRGEVISADSMQVYEGMDVGTAKATKSEMGGIEHHMLSVAPPSVRFSAAMYREMAYPILQDLLRKGKLPVLCGGTGLYIDALTRPMGFARPGDEAIRARLTEEAATQEGKERLHARLAGIDRETADRLSPNDVRRVVRALEIYELTGRSQTELNRLDQAQEPESDTVMFALEWPRDVLYRRIDKRVDIMMANGLEAEVRDLMASGLKEDSTAMQALGYKEMAAYLNGRISREEAVEAIKLGSRHYAKRQISWFKRDERVIWLPAEGRTAAELACVMAETIRRRR